MPSPPEPVGRTALDAPALRSALIAPAGPLAELVATAEATSTSTELAAALRADPGRWPEPSALLTDHQRAGRGRTGRDWSVPARSSVLVSLALRCAGVPVERWSWLPMLAGVALHRMLAGRGVEASLKWPNDVLITDPTGAEVPGWGSDRKIAGIMAELVETSAGPVAVVGIGLNVDQTRDELPVPWATSLRLAGRPVADREAVAIELITAVLADYRAWTVAGGDPAGSGLLAAVRRTCLTIGREVTVSMPDGSEVRGLARAVDDAGRLVVEQDGADVIVTAGDVRTVRR